MNFKSLLTVKNVAFLVLIVLVLKAIPAFLPIALLFFAGFVIASSLNPLVDLLSKKMKRDFAATIVLISALMVFFAFFVPVIFLLVHQLNALNALLPNNLDGLEEFIRYKKIFGHRLLEFVDLSSISGSVAKFSTEMFNRSISITISFVQGILFFLVICMLMFYFMADRDVIKKGILLLVPSDLQEKASAVYDEVEKNVGGYVVAQLLSMFAVGFFTALAMLVLGVQYPFLLGVITGILDIIPIIGPTIALVLCVLVGFQLGIVKIALIIVLFLAAQWASNNLVRPVIFGKFLNLHPLIIIFALLISAQFLGLWGVILAPAIASLIYILFNEIYIKNVNNKAKDE